MKALILAAGHGTRMGELTKKLPKCLLPIRGVPLLRIWLDLCAAQGITEVVINAHAHADAVHEFAREYRGSVSITVFEEAQLLGSAGTLAANRARFETEPFFWIFYGDVLTSTELGGMLHFHLQHGQDATLGLYRVSNPRACGIVSLEQGIVRSFEEKPGCPRSNLAFSGLMIATPAVLEEIPRAIPCDIGFHLLPRLVNRMAGYEISDYLADIGTIDAYTVAQQQWPGFSLRRLTSEVKRVSC